MFGADGGSTGHRSIHVQPGPDGGRVSGNRVTGNRVTRNRVTRQRATGAEQLVEEVRHRNDGIHRHRGGRTHGGHDRCRQQAGGQVGPDLFGQVVDA